jgi:glyceraldehyde-3-phosphate dehydrogenase/erythrose-4-phosphate dehydrogenase
LYFSEEECTAWSRVNSYWNNIKLDRAKVDAPAYLDVVNVDDARRNWFLFIEETDKRRGTNFLEIFPEMEGKIGGSGIRVPVPDGSLTDITCYVKRQVSIEQINRAFKIASETNLKGIVAYTEDPIVSVDIIGNSNSCLFDAQLTSVIGKMVKVVGWYDNEIGYSSRIIDLILLMENNVLLKNKIS